jgi:uncharacterized membrane protein HdeD (DUF308 family)
MLRALLHSCGCLVNTDGACWILALDAILLVPLLFAVFFYPMAALASLAVLAVLTLAVFGVVRGVHTYRHRPGV